MTNQIENFSGKDPDGEDSTGTGTAELNKHRDVVPDERTAERERMEQVRAIQKQTHERAAARVEAGYPPHPVMGVRPSQFILTDGKMYSAEREQTPASS